MKINFEMLEVPQSQNIAEDEPFKIHSQRLLLSLFSPQAVQLLCGNSQSLRRASPSSPFIGDSFRLEERASARVRSFFWSLPEWVAAARMNTNYRGGEKNACAGRK